MSDDFDTSALVRPAVTRRGALARLGAAAVAAPLGIAAARSAVAAPFLAEGELQRGLRALRAAGAPAELAEAAFSASPPPTCRGR